MCYSISLMTFSFIVCIVTMNNSIFQILHTNFSLCVVIPDGDGTITYNITPSAQERFHYGRRDATTDNVKACTHFNRHAVKGRIILTRKPSKNVYEIYTVLLLTFFCVFINILGHRFC